VCVVDCVPKVALVKIHSPKQKNNNMNKYQKLLASLLLALAHSQANLGNGHSPNRVLRLKYIIEKVEQKIFDLNNEPPTDDTKELLEMSEEEWEKKQQDAKDDMHYKFMHDIEQGRYDRLTPVKWDEVETYQDPNAGTSLEEELEQFEFDNRNLNQGER